MITKKKKDMGRETVNLVALDSGTLQFETKNQVQVKCIPNLQRSLQVLDFLSEQ